MIVIINKQMGSFQVLKTGAFTKWRDKKGWKDNEQYQHNITSEETVVSAECQ